MNRFMFRIMAIVIAVIMPLACSPDYADVKGDTFDPEKGSGTADFSVYVAIGNSLTAGIQSSGAGGVAGWRQTFQEVSYPNLIAQQLGHGANFTQPLLGGDGPTGWVDFDAIPFDTLGNPRFVVRNTNLDNTPSGPAPYHNMGVPGALLIESPTVTSSATSLTGNTAFDIVLQGQTWLARAGALNPTFVTFWLGNNEVLGAATQGSGTAVATPAQFGGAFRAMIGGLSGLPSSPDIAVGNIPDVTSIPFVTTIKMSDVDSLHKLNPALPAIPTLFAESNISYILLSAQTGFGLGFGRTIAGGLGPLPGSFTLTQSEVTSLRATTAQYNDSIAAIAATYGAAVFDANGLLRDIAAVSGATGSGYNIGGGINVKSDFISGGIFSLDGVHPNTLGYAVVANGFIKTINAHFGSSIPLLDLASYIAIP